MANPPTTIPSPLWSTLNGHDAGRFVSKLIDAQPAADPRHPQPNGYTPIQGFTMTQDVDVWYQGKTADYRAANKLNEFDARSWTNPELKVISVGMIGTAGMIDWSNNARLGNNAQVVTASIDYVKDQILNNVRPGYKILLGGHSLAGANTVGIAASLLRDKDFAPALAEKLKVDAATIRLGDYIEIVNSNPVANPFGAKDAQALAAAGIHVRNYVDPQDVVSRLFDLVGETYEVARTGASQPSDPLDAHKARHMSGSEVDYAQARAVSRSERGRVLYFARQVSETRIHTDTGYAGSRMNRDATRGPLIRVHPCSSPCIRVATPVVAPAEAGAHIGATTAGPGMDSRLRGNDGRLRPHSADGPGTEACCQASIRPRRRSMRSRRWPWRSCAWRSSRMSAWMVATGANRVGDGSKRGRSKRGRVWTAPAWQDDSESF